MGHSRDNPITQISNWFSNKQLSILETIRWEAFRDFFQIHFLRYFVIWFSIVPLFAFALKDIPDQITIETGSCDNCAILVSVGLPFEWQLLWLSSLSFIIALALYQFFCPKFIKKYHSFKHYKEYEHDGRWITREAARFLRSANKKRIAKFVNRLGTKKYLSKADKQLKAAHLYKPKVEELQTSIQIENNGEQYVLKTPVLCENGKEVPNSEAGIFWEVYALESDSRLPVRITIFILLIASLLLFVSVTGQHILAGLEYAFPKVSTWLM